MMKVVTTILLVLSLSGCSRDGGYGTQMRMSQLPPGSLYCIDGVVYYNMHFRLAVAFNQDSTVKTCAK